MTFISSSHRIWLSLLTATVLYPLAAFAVDAPLTDAASASAKPAEAPAADVTASDHGVNIKLLYTGEEWANASGGNKTGTTNINNVDAQVAVDADKALGWKGGSFLLDTMYNNGRSANSLTGAKQTQSPIDASGPQIFRVLQAWYNQDFDDNRTSLLAGLYLANSEFNLLDSETLFFNGGYSWNTALNQSGHNSPSVFPNAALGTRLKEKLDDAGIWTLQAAVLDGTPNNANHLKDNTIIINHKNGALLLGEADYHPSDKTKVMLGYWRYTAKFNEEFTTDASGNPKQSSNDQGLYAGINQHLYSFDDKRGIDSFMNLGMANGNVNRFDQTASAGINVLGLLKDRADDRLGFAFNVAHNGNQYRQSQTAAGNEPKSTEIDYELTYRAVINDWLTFQPDIQYIVNPGTDSTRKNALVFGAHLEIGRGFTF